MAVVVNGADGIAGCIGGCGGNPYSSQASIAGSPVQAINVWYGCGAPNNAWRGIQLNYFDGTVGLHAVIFVALNFNQEKTFKEI